MRTAEKPRYAITIIACIFLVPHVVAPYAAGQQDPQIAEIRSLLREASQLVPQMEPDQQSSAAANVVRLQVMAGDMEGALATTQKLSRPRDHGLSFEMMASALAAQGKMQQADSLISDRMEGSEKATAYQMVAGQSAAKGDFTSALATARLMLGDDQQLYLFVGTFMRIYVAQWKADDRAGARQTLREALAITDKEARKPGSSKSAICQLYRGIASALDEAGNSTEALPFVERIHELVDQEEDSGQKSLLLRELAYAEVAAGDYPAAMRRADALASANERDFVLETIAMRRAAHGDPEGGLEMMKGISNPILCRSYLEYAADRLAASNRYNRALSLLDTIPEAKDRAYALASLALQQAEREDRNALFTVQLAWTTAVEAKPEAEHSVFELIAVTRGILGDFPGALAIVDRMDATSRVWPLWNLSASMVAAGRKDEALALARTQESAHPKAYGLVGVASALLEQMDAERKSAKNK